MMRSYDERSHTYLGYVLIINGDVEGETREFIVAIGKAAQAKHGFQAGDQVEGISERVLDERLEVVKLYKTGN